MVQPGESKPFVWVKVVQPQRDAVAAYDQRDPQRRTLRLMLSLRVVSAYLHVGSGQLGMREKRAYWRFARAGDRILLPGSGVKGAVRALAEALSCSCMPYGAEREDPRPCGPIPRGASEIRLCPACRLFGATGYRGRVLFEDALPEGEVQTEIIPLPPARSPRRSEGRKLYPRRDFRLPAPGSRIRWVEAVPQGTRFRLRLLAENVDGAELGLLLRALGLEVRAGKLEAVLAIPMGGGKPLGLGSVKAEEVRVEEWDPRALIWRAVDPAEMARWDLRDLIREEVWQDLRRWLPAGSV
jgi:CRISPR/Cas system CSM-associated protein Csm3 (group 7 of RAMP superfamily)